MFFYSQPNLTCTRVSHSNPASYSRPREIGQISHLICLFLVDCDRPIVGFTLALNSLISIVFCDQMPEMLLKISQLATFPWKCLALPCCSISLPSFHRKLKLAFGCRKSVCCSFRFLKVRLLISVLKRIVSVNEFLPLSLKVKGSKRNNELKRFCGQISKWKSFNSMQLTEIIKKSYLVGQLTLSSETNAREVEP